MKRNHFDEQFEDSQANFSEVGMDPGDERDQGKPMQLLRVLPSGRIELVEETLSLIASCETEVGFVSIVGRMRTGKSCLLNRLLGLTGRGFRVDPSVSSCTQGIWIWSQPVFNQQSNCLVFFMDTEGSQSLQKDQENDAKIFTLSLLISSYLVYNSIGVIDQRSLSDLEMVTSLARQVRTDDRLTESENQQQLYRFMPRFVWLLRDHMLKIQDQYGRKITATQYLQNCLKDQQSSQTSKAIKRSLLTYFKDRECITMVRPVGDQSQLQRLDSIPDHALRREFVDVVGRLRDKLIKGCRPKNFGGEDVNGPAMVDMIQAFSQSFNSGKIPSIKSAWTQISQDEGAKAYNFAISRYEQIFRSQFSEDEPKSDEQLRQVLMRLRETTMKQFDDNIANKREHQDFRDRLKNLIDQKEGHIVEVNRNVCETKNHQILVKLSQAMKVKLADKSYQNNKKGIHRDMDNVVTQYNREAKGPGKAQILGEFMTTMMKAIETIQEDRPEKTNELSQAARIQMEEMQKKNQLLEKRLKAANEAAAAKQREDRKREKDRKAHGDNPRQKPETQGCCSGGCAIM